MGERSRRKKKCPISVMHGSLHDAVPGMGGLPLLRFTEAASFFSSSSLVREDAARVDQDGDHPADNGDKKEEGG
jgi:hypothetical protein